MNEILSTNSSEPAAVDATTPDKAESDGSREGTIPPDYHENNILSAQYRELPPDGDGPDGPRGKDSAPGLAEDYELRAPEGMEFDSAMVEQFTPVAKELGLNNAQAQKLADLYGARVRATSQEQLEQWKEIGTAAEDKVREDTELGGRGEAFLRKRRIMQRGLENLPQGDELAEAIHTGGAVHPNNAGLLRLLYREGLRISPDDFHGDGRTSRVSDDPKTILYPNQSTK